MMSDTSFDPNNPALWLPFIQTVCQRTDGHVYGMFGGLELGSRFQPIYSFAHQRAIGFEALLDARTLDGQVVCPLDVFNQFPETTSMVAIDRLSRAVHIENYCRDLPDEACWLFLNVHPASFIDAIQSGAHLPHLLGRYHLPAEQVVLEILESQLADEALLEAAVTQFRSYGCLIAIDDFGAGHSNFDRIWRLQPDIVKLDRTMIAQAGRDAHIRRLMPKMVSLLHEAGALVLVEGVETEDEALIAMDADADFVQGFYFARPRPRVEGTPQHAHLFPNLWQDFHRVLQQQTRQRGDELAIYRDALHLAASKLAHDVPLAQACAAFVELPRSERCFLLDARGCQVGKNVVAAHCNLNADQRFAPLHQTEGALWSRRHYFRRALSAPSEVQVTRPYLSLTGGNLCVTLSVALECDEACLVLCGDVAWDELPNKRRVGIL